MRYVILLLALFAIAGCTTASAALIDDINSLRRKGCEGRSVATPLQADRELDAVARTWSRGGRLRDALERTGYRAVNSASMRIEGAPNDQALLRALVDNYCETLMNPAFTSIGIERSPGAAHIVVALPLTAPDARDATSIARRTLSLVNEARSKPRSCGSTRFAAVPPLAESAMLARAALTHAQDMARRDFFEHQGSDGSGVAQRVTRTGYVWKFVGENIYAGATTPDAVVAGWLKSPGHCANIMNGQFTEMGIAYASNAKSEAGIYWAQVLATPRK